MSEKIRAFFLKSFTYQNSDIFNLKNLQASREQPEWKLVEIVLR